ncbi:MAG: T9SS type A sorting domain-containing protein [Gelidibacter sp.]
MKNYYSILFLIIGLGFGATTYAQSDPSKTSASPQDGINDLSIYPNPVSNGKIYITTLQNLTKEIQIYDVLGKNVLSTSLFGKELNISKLTPGIYILKIKEGNSSSTRKLVVR